VKPLIEILKKCPADDTHLRMVAKIALRNCLRDDPKAWPDGDDAVFVEVAVAIPNRKAAEYLVTRLKAKTLPADKLNAAVEHAVRYGAVADDEYLFGWLSLQQNSDALAAGIRGAQARGVRLDKALTERLIQRGASDSLAEGFQGSNPETANVKLVSWGLRTLKTLPAVGDRESLKLGDAHVEALANVAGRPNAPVEVRVGVVEVLLIYAPVSGLKAVRKQLADATTPDTVRVGLLLAAASSNLPGVQAEARDGLKTVPYRVAVPIGLALAGTKDGADILLVAVKEGKAPQRLLQEQAILERLKASNAPDWQKRVADLTKSLPPADQRIADLLKKRAAGFATAKVDKAEGAKLFTKHCAACHRIGDVGGKIAPQLDGIGVRGVERLLEDVLDPNRNVDQAFRARSITLTNDKTLTALMLRVEGEVLVVADLEGKEQRIPLKEIAVNRETMLSAMPANFDTVVPEADMYSIIAYLLDQKAKDPPKK
jgi:putative heme-binding domain-containing protein